MKLFLATNEGVVSVSRGQQRWELTGRNLNDHHVTSITAREGVILAGTETGIFRSDDQGATWQEAGNGLRLPHVRWLAYHPTVSDLEFAGTEPAAIFRSRDGGPAGRSARK